MTHKNDDNPLWHGAWITAIIAFFGTWIFAFVLFNFLGLVLGWIPALIVAVVVYFTAPFFYLLLDIVFFLIFLTILIMVGAFFLL